MGGSENSTDRVKDKEMHPDEMTMQDLSRCSPTIPGWILSNKIWAEFAVHLVQDIKWNPDAFKSLQISDNKKQVIKSLADAYMSSNGSFDDFVAGKGKGVVVLLHGPPGVGKTLTAETLSEDLRKPLYSISAGELGENAVTLEERLRLIFRLARHWQALVLLDEADVYAQERSQNHTTDGLISVFLRMLEYYQGVMFLTTNRVKIFDPAFKSRISVALKYDHLSATTRCAIWVGLLKKASTQSGPAIYKLQELEDLVRKPLNGRQIKNSVAAAFAPAIGAGKAVSFEHLSDAVKANEEFDADFFGAGSVENLNSYS